MRKFKVEVKAENMDPGLLFECQPFRPIKFESE